MPRRVMTYVVLALVGLLILPAAALSASGGSGLDPSGGMGAPSGSGSPDVQSGTTPVTATSNGITLTTTSSALLRNTLGFAGSAPTGSAGQTLEIERLGHETNWQWTPTTQATINSDGTFSTTWTTNHIGRFLIRAVVGGTSASAASASAPRPSPRRSTGRRSQPSTDPASSGAGPPAVRGSPVRPSASPIAL